MIKIKAKEALDVHKHIWNGVISMIEKDGHCNIHEFKEIACHDIKICLPGNCVGCSSLPRNKKTNCENCILNLGDCMDYYYGFVHHALDKHLLIKLAKKIRDCGLRPGIDPEQIVHLREIIKID